MSLSTDERRSTQIDAKQETDDIGSELLDWESFLDSVVMASMFLASDTATPSVFICVHLWTHSVCKSGVGVGGIRRGKDH